MPEQSVLRSPDELCCTHVVLPLFTQTIQILQYHVYAPSLSSPALYPSSHHQILNAMPFSRHDQENQVAIIVFITIHFTLLLSVHVYFKFLLLSVSDTDILTILCKSRISAAIDLSFVVLKSSFDDQLCQEYS